MIAACRSLLTILVSLYLSLCTKLWKRTTRIMTTATLKLLCSVSCWVCLPQPPSSFSGGSRLLPTFATRASATRSMTLPSQRRLLFGLSSSSIASRVSRYKASASPSSLNQLTLAVILRAPPFGPKTVRSKMRQQELDLGLPLLVT